MLDIFLWIFTIYGVYRLLIDIFELKNIINNKSKMVIRISEKSDSIIKSINYILQNERSITVRIEDIGLDNNTYEMFNNLKNKYDNLEVVKL